MADIVLEVMHDHVVEFVASLRSSVTAAAANVMAGFGRVLCRNTGPHLKKFTKKMGRVVRRRSEVWVCSVFSNESSHFLFKKFIKKTEVLSEQLHRLCVPGNQS